MKLPALALALLAVPAASQQLVFLEDFENGIGGWFATSLWHVEDSSQTCGALVAPFPSGTKAAYFGGSVGCTYEGFTEWQWHDGDLTKNVPIALPADAGSIALSFHTRSSAEDDGVWDTRRVQISADGFNWTPLPLVFSSGWVVQRYDITAWKGQSIRLRFEFWSGDWMWNNFLGWFLDDIRIESYPGPATPFCLGDGSWTACPCSNFGAAGHGCATSFNPAGAHLSAAGVASVGADTLVLSASGMSIAAATFFQGAAMQTHHPSMINGDGLRCAAGTVLRIRTVFAPNGSASYPAAGEVPISVQGALPALGGTRYYQARYRNAANFCTPATFNLTNGLIVTWAP
ncbi:MAG: hypothetical protein JNK02_17860 [Planctomycetes bacterium]|nr:hypothetical protein [Planctomycetota bacterium]